MLKGDQIIYKAYQNIAIILLMFFLFPYYGQVETHQIRDNL